MKPYPALQSSAPAAVKAALDFIARERLADIAEFGNLPNIYMRGRKVGVIPSGSSDVAATDRVGDFNYDADYFYICVNNSGTAEWRRTALGSW